MHWYLIDDALKIYLLCCLGEIGISPYLLGFRCEGDLLQLGMTLSEGIWLLING